MADLIPFQFEADTIRVIEDAGEVWFVARDVATALGYGDPSTSARRHCKGATKRLPLSTPGGMQDAVCIQEADVMRLVIRSRLPQAQRFERWVFEEVLPTIARTGRYGQPAPAPVPAGDPMAVLADPAALRGLLLTYTERVQALEGEVQAAAPKVAALDRIATAAGSLCITDAAKELGVRPKALFAWMQERTWIYRRGSSGWVAYQPRLNQGVLEHKVMVVTDSDGNEHVRDQVRVTPKGLARMAELLAREGMAGSAGAAG